MNKLTVFSVSLIMLLTVQTFFAQEETRPPGGIPANSPPQWVQRVQDARERQSEQLKNVNEVVSSTAGMSPAERSEAIRRQKAAEAEKRKTLEEINRIISPPVEYYSKYAEFLKTKNTGIARVFPDRDCDKGLIVDVKELERCGNTAQIKGAGSLYSFRLSSLPEYLSLASILSYVSQSDMHFVNDKFVVGNDMTQDIIANLGDANLADITPDSDSVKFLKTFKPSDTAPQLEVKKQTLATGVSANGYFYSSSAPIKLNDTYVLRSIAYYREYKTFWNTDLLVAFKVVGQEKDGSVVILWKKLKQKDAPALSRK